MSSTPTGKTHRLNTVADMARLSHDEFARMLPEFAAWFAIVKSAQLLGVDAAGFVWTDDGNAGNVTEVSLTDSETGETHRWSAAP